MTHAIEVARYYNLREYIFAGDGEKCTAWKTPSHYPREETVYVRDKQPPSMRKEAS